MYKINCYSDDTNYYIIRHPLKNRSGLYGFSSESLLQCEGPPIVFFFKCSTHDLTTIILSIQNSSSHAFHRIKQKTNRLPCLVFVHVFFSFFFFNLQLINVRSD